MGSKRILATIRLLTVKLVRLLALFFASGRADRAGASRGLPLVGMLSLRFLTTQRLLEHGHRIHTVSP